MSQEDDRPRCPDGSSVSFGLEHKFPEVVLRRRRGQFVFERFDGNLQSPIKFPDWFSWTRRNNDPELTFEVIRESLYFDKTLGVGLLSLKLESHIMLASGKFCWWKAPGVVSQLGTERVLQ